MACKITLSQLRKAHACTPQVSLFEATFGEEVEVSAALALKYASKFDFSWAARNLLSPQAYKSFRAAMTPASEAYDIATAPARKAYRAAIASAYKAYDATTASTRKVYLAAMASADKAYNAATASVYAAYEATMALAFFHAYESDVQQPMTLSALIDLAGSINPAWWLIGIPAIYALSLILTKR